MWSRLILPDCATCDVRKASSWKDRLCHPCRAEVQLLEELLAIESIEGDPQT